MNGKPLYCTKHKRDGMFNVIHKSCLEEGCKTRPTYGTHLSGQIHCSKHCNKKKNGRSKPVI